MSVFKHFNLLVFCLLIALSSCQKNDEDIEIQIEILKDDAVRTEVVAEFIDDDIEKLVLFHLFALVEEYEKGGTIETHVRPNPYTGRNDCASVAFDKSDGSLIIGFKNRCNAVNGIYRSGKIIVALSGFSNGVYEHISISLENYSVQYIGVQGNRTISNMTQTDFPYQNITVNVENGQLTFLDGTSYSYTSQREVTSTVFGDDADIFIFTTEFSKQGLDRNNEPFDSFSMEKVAHRGSCYNAGARQINSGTLVISKDRDLKSVEFNPDNCGLTVLVTRADGSLYQVDLTQLSINN